MARIGFISHQLDIFQPRTTSTYWYALQWVARNTFLPPLRGRVDAYQSLSEEIL
eukprot:m.142926 g.142926  ORF g.142926 m.142926 type:complete len:54 (-) comp14890_c0_seq9:1243-1404(-)